MTILDRYIFRNVLGASLGAVGVFVFVLVIGNVVKDLLGHVAAGRLSLEKFLQLLFLITGSVVSFALPMGILTGILLVLGRLSAQQEVTAMRAAGWGLWRIARPILVLAVLGSAATLYFNLELGPRSSTLKKEILAQAVETNPVNYVVAREFVQIPGAQKTILFVGSKEGNRLRDVWCWRLDAKDRVTYSAHAAEGSLRYDREKESLEFELPNGAFENRGEKAPEDFSGQGESLAMPVGNGSIPLSIPLVSLFGKKTQQRKLSLQTFSEQREELARTEANAEGLSPADRFKRLVQVRFAMQKSFATAFAVLAFAIVGVPLGIKMQRKESSANLGLALLLSMTFYLALIIVDLLQKQPGLRPDLLLWLPCAGFGALGLWLFRRVDAQ